MIVNLENNKNRLKISTVSFRLYYVPIEDVDFENFPKPVNKTISSNVLKPGKKHRFLDAKTNSINPSGTAGDSKGNIKLEISPQIEGISEEVLDFIYTINGQRVIVFWEDCNSGKMFIAGNKCSAGLEVAVNSLGKMDDGFWGAILQMTGGDCPEPFWYYDGPILLDEPATIAANSTTFALTDKYQYQLPENTAETILTNISGVANDDVDRKLEIIGGGVNFPTKINPSSKFILRNGVSWTGTQGSRITFQVTMTGQAQYTFFEINRS